MKRQVYKLKDTAQTDYTTLDPQNLHLFVDESEESGGGVPITIDAIPTDGSNNAVSSNGVFDALATKQSNLGFVPENVSNKNNTTLNNSATEYPTSGLVLKEREAIVVSSSQTAVLNRVHNVVATAILTDATPVEGMGYLVNVINGVATVGGVDYTVGAQLFRHYHSGSWRTFEYLDKSQIVRNIIKDLSISSAVTGTVSEVITASYLIKGGSLPAEEFLNLINFLGVKTGAAGVVTQRIKLNTINSLSGAVQIFQMQGGNTVLFNRSFRRYKITGGNLRGIGLAINIGNGSDIGAFLSSTPYTSTPLDVSNDFYILTTATLTSSADSYQQHEFQMTN